MSATEYLYNWTWTGYNPIAAGWAQCSPEHQFGPDVREFYVIHYVLSGKGTLTMRGKTYQLSEGAMFVFEPYETVSYAADPDDPWQYVWVNFIINGQVPYMFNSPVHYWPELRSLFVNIMEHPDHQHTGRDFVSDCIWKIARLISSNDLDDKFIVDKAVKFISSHYASPSLSVADIANSLMIKQSKLSKLFLQEKNMTTAEYLIRYRLRKACNLMLRQNCTPTTAAMLVGYHDYANFSKIFKKYYGISPSKYKEEPNTTPTPAGSEIHHIDSSN